jgi:hypothetical protein
MGRGYLTVHVFVSEIFQSQIDHLVGSSHDLVCVYIASEGVPTIPTKCWQSALVKLLALPVA